MAKYKPFVIPFVIALLVLGGIAWSLGWLAHAAVDRAAAPPAPLPTMTATVAVVSPATPTTLAQPQADPTATPTAVPSIAATPANLNPTSTLQPTSALLPEPIPTPYHVWVQQGQGVLAICRDHCPNFNTTNDGLLECVRRVAKLNNLRGSRNDPRVYIGQQLQMPPECFSQ